MTTCKVTKEEYKRCKLAKTVTHPPRSLLCVAAPLLPIARTAATPAIDEILSLSQNDRTFNQARCLECPSSCQLLLHCSLACGVLRDQCLHITEVNSNVLSAPSTQSTTRHTARQLCTYVYLVTVSACNTLAPDALIAAYQQQDAQKPLIWFILTAQRCTQSDPRVVPPLLLPLHLPLLLLHVHLLIAALSSHWHAW
jgi:hypothetical protein